MTDLSTTAGKLADLAARTREAIGAGDGDQTAGTEGARAQVLALLDPGSFTEVDALARHRVTAYGADATRPYTDGVVAGYGTVDGRKVCVFAEDPTIFEGRMGEVHGEKIVKIQQLAQKTGVPLIGFYAGRGARPAEGTTALAMYARILREATRASGVIPQVAVVADGVAGPHRLLPRLADIVIGPTADADIVAPDAEEAVHRLRELIGFLASNNRAEPPRPLAAEERSVGELPALDALVPDDPEASFDAAELVGALADDAVLELAAGREPGILTSFIRIQGRTVGVVAAQPAATAGITADACAKAADFVRFLDAFNIPILTLTDVVDLPEDAGAPLAVAYAEATVGMVTVVVRDALGAGYVALGAKDLGVDLVYAWPTARIAAMPAADAVPTLYAKEIAKATRKGKDVDSLIASRSEEYDAEHLSAYQAAERGMVDAVIEPRATRSYLEDAFRLLDRKVVPSPQRKHATVKR